MDVIKETEETEEYLGKTVFVTTKDVTFKGRRHRRVSCDCGNETLRVDMENDQREVILLAEPDDEGFATVEIRANWDGETPLHTEFYTDDDRMAFWLGFAYAKLGISIPVVKTVEFYKPEE